MIIEKNPLRQITKWTKGERKTLKTMFRDGKAIKEISKKLGRSIAAVASQKSQMEIKGLMSRKTKVIKSVKQKVTEQDALMDSCDNLQTPTKEQAKELSSMARQIARVNGKRITMSIHFMEDL